MAKLEEGIGDFVRPKNTFESQGESIQDSCKQCSAQVFKRAGCHLKRHFSAVNGPSKGHFSAVNGPSKGHFSAVNGPSKGHFSAMN